MERRKEQRITLPGTARLRLLDALGTERDTRDVDGPWDVRILDVSGSGMRLRLPRPLPCGTLVEIDAGETLSLGEVCRCVPEQPATPEGQNTTYNVGIQVKHTLASLNQLERFSRMLDEYAGGRKQAHNHAGMFVDQAVRAGTAAENDQLVTNESVQE